MAAASAPAAGAVCEPPPPGRGGAAGTQGGASGNNAGARNDTRQRQPVVLTERERFELELHCLRVEWAADGGDGSICSTGELLDDIPTLNLEWILHGPLLEALAAITWKPLEAQQERLEEPEKSRGAAA